MLNESNNSQNLSIYFSIQYGVSTTSDNIDFSPIINDYMFCLMQDGKVITELKMNYEVRPKYHVGNIYFDGTGNFKTPRNVDRLRYIPGSLKFFCGKLSEELFVVCERRNIAIVKYVNGNAKAFYVIPPRTYRNSDYNIPSSVKNSESYSGGNGYDKPYSSTLHNLENIRHDFACYSPSIQYQVLRNLNQLTKGSFRPFIYCSEETSLINPQYQDVMGDIKTIYPKYLESVDDGLSNSIVIGAKYKKETKHNNINDTDSVSSEFSENVLLNLNGEAESRIISTPSCHLFSTPKIPEYAFSKHNKVISKVYDEVLKRLDRILYQLFGKVTGLKGFEISDYVKDGKKRSVEEVKITRFVKMPSAVYLIPSQMDSLIEDIDKSVNNMKRYSNLDEVEIEVDVTHPYFFILVVLNMILYAPSKRVALALKSILSDVMQILTEKHGKLLGKWSENQECEGVLSLDDVQIVGNSVDPLPAENLELVDKLNAILFSN